MPITHQDAARALERIKGMSTLPDHRLRALLAQALCEVAAMPGVTEIPTVDRIVMLAVRKILAEEQALEADR